MDKAAVLSKLREHEPELRAAGIVHLRLFGSFARGEQRPDSDVDLLAEFDRTRRLGVFGVVGIKLRLEELLGVQVDLSEVDRLREHIRPGAMRDAEAAF